jgi:Zn ribbon nucleic-acid-binding protein
MPNCPECGSDRIYKDGLRYTNERQIQRYLCRNCGYRFSDKSYKECQTKSNRQICALKVKNLESAQKHKFCAGDVKKVDVATKGLLTQFYAYLEKEAYSVESDYVDKVKHLAVLGANLRDPEHVKKNHWANETERRPKNQKRNKDAVLLCLQCFS